MDMPPWLRKVSYPFHVMLIDVTKLVVVYGYDFAIYFSAKVQNITSSTNNLGTIVS